MRELRSPRGKLLCRVDYQRGLLEFKPRGEGVIAYAWGGDEATHTIELTYRFADASRAKRFARSLRKRVSGDTSVRQTANDVVVRGPAGEITAKAREAMVATGVMPVATF